jgi:hypothetical protein
MAQRGQFRMAFDTEDDLALLDRLSYRSVKPCKEDAAALISRMRDDDWE